MRTIILKEKEYPILFSMNVIEEVQKRYPDLSKVTEILNDFSEVRWILKTIINEGIAYRNYMDGTNDKPLTEQQIGFLVDLKTVNEGLQDAIVGAFNDSLGDEKNLTAEQLMKISETMLKKK